MFSKERIIFSNQIVVVFEKFIFSNENIIFSKRIIDILGKNTIIIIYILPYSGSSCGVPTGPVGGAPARRCCCRCMFYDYLYINIRNAVSCSRATYSILKCCKWLLSHIQHFTIISGSF